MWKEGSRRAVREEDKFMEYRHKKTKDEINILKLNKFIQYNSLKK